MKRKAALLLLFLACIPLDSFTVIFAADQSLTRSTEYTSPFGDYSALSGTRSLQIGDNASVSGTATVYGNLDQRNGTVKIYDSIAVDGATLHTQMATRSAWPSYWTGVRVAGEPSAEMQVNGDILAKRFRAESGNPSFQDQMLYFGVDAAKSRGEMGCRTALGWNHASSIARFHGNPSVCLNHYSSLASPTNPPRVMIGTTTPVNPPGQIVGHYTMLQVGDTTNLLNILGFPHSTWSSREYKKAIEPMSVADRTGLFRDFESMNLVTYRYKSEPERLNPRLGVIAEDAPGAMLSETGETVSLSNTFGFLLTTIQNLKAENDILEKEISKLEAAAESQKHGERR